MTVYAKDFGTADNFAMPFAEMIKNVNNGDTIELEKREYHFYKDYCQSRIIHITNTDSFKNPKKYFAMLIENKENITINGNGATLVVHGDICALALLGCKNVTLRNFTVKYASPSNTELVVKEKKGTKVLFEIPESTLWYVDGKDVVFFEQSRFTKQNYWQFRNDENSWNSVCHSGEDVFRTLHFRAPFSFVKRVERKSLTQVEITYFFKRSFRVGDVYAFSQNKNRNTCGIFFSECENITSENLEVNYLQGFGWLSQMCDTVSFKNITFRPDSEHHVSSFADLIHVCGCKGSVTVDGCDFCHPHDDAINIHGAFLRFKEKVDDKTAVFEFVHNQQGGYSAFFSGDKARLYYRSDLQEIGEELTVDTVSDDIDSKTCTIKFRETLPNEITARRAGQSNVVIENVSYCPDVEIMNCKFHAIPTRGILCTTSGKTKIHNNVFTHIAMAHIFISNDASDWYESGPVRDVEIYENEFYMQPTKQYEQLNCNGVLVMPVTLGRRISKPVHKNISIHSNSFEVGRSTPVKAIGVENIDIHSNNYKGSSRIILKHCKK